MGTCTPSYTHSSSKSLPEKAFSYQNLVQCPEGHPLAFFKTGKCSGCSSPFSKAVVNCISCEFGLCQRCFDSNFDRVVKKIEIQDRNILTNLLAQLKSEKEENQELIPEAIRLKKYIMSKFEEQKDIRVEGCPLLRQSIKIRTQMVKNYLLIRSKSR